MVERICKDFSADLFSHFANYFLLIRTGIKDCLHIERDEPSDTNQKKKTPNENQSCTKY